MSVNVGEVTSSCDAASNASAIPFTMVVLPAPRSPRSKTSLGGRSSAASFRPSSIVSSAELVVYSRIYTLVFKSAIENRKSTIRSPMKNKSLGHQCHLRPLERLRQIGNQITRHER